MTSIPPARAAALLAILAERERQDRLHGFHPERPLGFGVWWARLLDKALHWANERARRRGRTTWALVLAEEFFEVLAARTVPEAVKELRELAALGVKVEEALVAAGRWNVPGHFFATHEDGTVGLCRRADATPPSLTGAAAAEAFRQYASTFTSSPRTVADCQALLGAMELALLLGADHDALARVEQSANLGTALAALLRRKPGAAACTSCAGAGLRKLPCRARHTWSPESCPSCAGWPVYCGCGAGEAQALRDAGPGAEALERMRAHVSEQLSEWAAERETPRTEDMLRIVQALVDATVSLHEAAAEHFGFIATFGATGLEVHLYRRRVGSH